MSLKLELFRIFSFSSPNGYQTNPIQSEPNWSEFVPPTRRRCFSRLNPPSVVVLAEFWPPDAS